MKLELGVDTFGDVTRGADGEMLSHAQVIRNVIDCLLYTSPSPRDS